MIKLVFLFSFNFITELVKKNNIIQTNDTISTCALGLQFAKQWIWHL